MKRISWLFIFMFTIYAYTQNVETILKTDFAIRDFVTNNDSVYFIKKRDVYLLDLKNNQSKQCFVGGYGLEMEYLINSKILVTASNELVENISSVRFFNSKSDTPEDAFFYKNGRILDFLLIPELNVFALSLTTKKIIVVSYLDRPKFYKTIEIDLDVLARKISFKDNSLYFSTDIGEIYKYDFKDFNKTLIYNFNELITDFLIDKENLICSTIGGKLKSVKLDTFTVSSLSFNNNFINLLTTYDDENLICGSWNGKIFIIDLKTFSIKKEFNFHSRSILQLKKIKNQKLYSTSLDKTLKKWELN